MRSKKHRPKPKVNMSEITIEGIDYLIITVRKDAKDFIVDNAMQYLVYKVPAYENWVTDEELEDPFKLMAYLEKHEHSEQYRLTGCKLPDGKWKCLGIANDNGFDNHIRKLGFNPQVILMLKPLTDKSKQP